MSYNESQDSEFDPGMERILRQHFESESEDLRSPNDPWEWLESRMEEPQPPSFLSRITSGFGPLTQFRVSPAFAGAGVAVVAVAVAAAVWAVSGDGGPEQSGGIAALPPTEAPVSASAATTAPVISTEVPANAANPTVEATVESVASEETSPAEQADTRQAATAGATTTISETTGEAADSPAPTNAIVPTAIVASVSTPAPQATTAPPPTRESVAVTRIVEVETVEEVEAESGAMAAPAAPMATAAPAAMASVPAPPKSDALLAAPASHPSRPPRPIPTVAPGIGRTPTATTFRDYQRQQFVAAADDNVSTFSLDTDRTSFQLALNWARAGYEIDPDSVRAEEWLNAFNYEYNPPSSNDEFAVVGDLFPHPLDDEKHLARIAFQAPELVDNKPLNVTLVLDASGSMADGNRVGIARQAAESIRQSLRPNDRIAVVHFTQDVIRQNTVEHTHPADNDVRRSISWLQPHGSTNVQAGLNLGVRLAAEARQERPDAYNYVILMSDGVANVDATDPFSILETSYDPDSSNPIRLITIGVGINNYNDPLLEQLAQHGNGWYRYLDSTEQAQATFARENWLALSTPFADQTRAQVTWNTEAVERWRIIGYENRVTADENFTQDRKEFAEIYSSAATTVLYELELTEAVRSSSSHTRIGAVELRWVDPDTGDSRSQSTTLTGNPTADFAGREGTLANFGAIVALTADLYGILPKAENLAAGSEALPEVHSALSTMQEQMRALGGELGTLDSYRDFSFLLNYLANNLEEKLPPSARSGYSR